MPGLFPLLLRTWLKANPIPAEYPSWGRFNELQERNREVLHGILEKAAAKSGSDFAGRAIGDLYASCMDEAPRARGDGSSPVQPLPRTVSRLKDSGRASRRRGGPRSKRGPLAVPFAFDADKTRERRPMITAERGPGRPRPARPRRLLRRERPSVALREAYVGHVAAQLVNLGAGPEQAAEDAAAILELETALAEPQLKAEEQRDPSNTLNRHTLDEVDVLAPDLPVRAHLVALGLGDVASVNVQQPRYVAALGAILADTDRRGCSRPTPGSTCSTRRPRRYRPASTTRTSRSTAV